MFFALQLLTKTPKKIKMVYEKTEGKAGCAGVILCQGVVDFIWFVDVGGAVFAVRFMGNQNVWV